MNEDKTVLRQAVRRKATPEFTSVVDPRELAKLVRRRLASLSRLDATSVRNVRNECSVALQNRPAKDVYRFVRALLDGAHWAERVVAWEILVTRRAAFQLLNDKEIEKMAKGLSDWASVDLFGVTIVGQAWREGLVSEKAIHSWTRSADRWRRRLALVATVPLNSKARGGKGDARRTLQVCKILLDDRDDMVVKALSWALRELSKRDPDAVRSFVDRENNRIAPRVKREVNNKLTTGRKNPGVMRRHKKQAPKG